MHRVTAARRKRLLTVGALFASVFAPFATRAQAPGTPSSAIVSTPLLANDRVSAIKLSFPPGARETSHRHPFDIIVIQLTPGDVELMLDGKESAGAIEPGRTTFISAQTLHSAGNAGTVPFDMVVVALR